jgi:hypothetical protein
LSAIMASTKVVNCARKPGWRIAAKDRILGAGGLTPVVVSSIGTRFPYVKYDCCDTGADHPEGFACLVDRSFSEAARVR